MNKPTVTEKIARCNLLRALRLALRAAETERDKEERARVEAELEPLEEELRALPEARYLFAGATRGRCARKNEGKVPDTDHKEVDDMSDETKTTKPAKADKPAAVKKVSAKQAQAIEENAIALRRAEKSLASTKWALDGAGAAKNPPSDERKKALTKKAKAQAATVKALRAERDKLRAA